MFSTIAHSIQVDQLSLIGVMLRKSQVNWTEMEQWSRRLHFQFSSGNQILQSTFLQKTSLQCDNSKIQDGASRTPNTHVGSQDESEGGRKKFEPHGCVLPVICDQFSDVFETRCSFLDLPSFFVRRRQGPESCCPCCVKGGSFGGWPIATACTRVWCVDLHYAGLTNGHHKFHFALNISNLRCFWQWTAEGQMNWTFGHPDLESAQLQVTRRRWCWATAGHQTRLWLPLCSICFSGACLKVYTAEHCRAVITPWNKNGKAHQYCMAQLAFAVPKNDVEMQVLALCRFSWSFGDRGNGGAGTFRGTASANGLATGSWRLIARLFWLCCPCHSYFLCSSSVAKPGIVNCWRLWTRQRLTLKTNSAMGWGFTRLPVLMPLTNWEHLWGGVRMVWRLRASNAFDVHLGVALPR